MKRFLKRASGAVAVVLGASFLPVLAASPAGAAPGAQPPPTVSPNPVALAADNFSLSNGTCDGTGGQGWRVQTFIVNDGVNVGSLVFDQGPTSDRVGIDRDNTDGTIRSPLWKDAAPGTGYNPAASPAGLINPSDLSGFDFSNSGWVLTDGVYQVGYACINDVGATSQWWARTVTIDAAPAGGAFMVQGRRPAAPVLNSVQAGVQSQTITVDFTPPAAADPAVTGYTINVVQAGTTTHAAGSPFSVAGSPQTISGLTNGQAYDVTVTANNDVGSSAPSNTITATPSEPLKQPVTNFAATAGFGTVSLTWTPPTDGPSGYEITSNVAGVGPFSVTPGSASSYEVTGLDCNTSYTFTNTPQHSTGTDGAPASTAAVTPFCADAQILVQEIMATRPVGQLVLTQVCLTNGTVPADLTPRLGFPGGHAQVDSNAPSFADAPTTGGNAPGLSPGTWESPSSQTTFDYWRSATADDRSQYPYPTDVEGVPNARYETYCGIDLGVAKLVTRGAGAGQFFAASGPMSQITVVDTRDDDPGWAVNGNVSDFENAEGDKFSGNQLGWDPSLWDTTDAFEDALGNSYAIRVTEGGLVLPNTEVGDDGLGDGGRALATATARRVAGTTTPGSCEPAAPNEGTAVSPTACEGGNGVAVLDGRLDLLIPITADDGDYTATLTFTVT